MPVATVVATSEEKGFFFAEVDDTHESIFIHIRNVERRRYLKPGDRIDFDVVPNPRKSGEVEGINVKWLGNIRQNRTGAPR